MISNLCVDHKFIHLSIYNLKHNFIKVFSFFPNSTMFSSMLIIHYRFIALSFSFMLKIDARSINTILIIIITNSGSFFPTFLMDIQCDMGSIEKNHFVTQDAENINFNYIPLYMHLTYLHTSRISLFNIYSLDMYL